jgi:hypothetical protein
MLIIWPKIYNARLLRAELLESDDRNSPTLPGFSGGSRPTQQPH